MRKRKGEQPMNKNKRERKFLKGFKSIQSTIFVAVCFCSGSLCGACSDCSISKIYEFYSL